MRRRKKLKLTRKKKIIVGVVAAALLIVIVIAAFVLLRWRSRSKMPDMFSATNAQETTATKGDISNTIVGTGNLEMDTAVSIKIPSGLTIEKIYVESGDHVSKGDVLADADTVSVLEAMEDVQEKLDTIDEQIVEAQNGSDAETIYATVSGTVKKVYANEDEDVLSCMQDHGSLMIIIDEDGEKVKITKTSGTIGTIYVSEGDSVNVGDSLFTLAAEDVSSEYSTLMAKREALTDTMETLLALVEDNSIKADMDGTIQSVNIEEGDDDSSSSSGSSGSVMNMSYTAGSVKASTMGYKKSSTAGNLVYVSSAVTLSNDDLTYETLDEAQEAWQELLKQIEELKEEDYSEETWKTLSEAASDATEIAQKEDVTVEELTAAMKTVTAAIEALETASGSDDTDTSGSSSGSDTSGSSGSSGSGSSGSGSSGSSGSGSSGSGSSNKNSSSSNSKNKTTTTPTPTASASGTNGTQIASSGSGSGSSVQTAASIDDTTQSSSDDSDTVSQYSTDITAFTVSGDEQMILSVNVDELDINEVSKGQEAEITFDAIEDETFTGSVTKIGTTASSSGGVTKYSVEITIPKSDEMKVGMNASATIVIEEKTDVVTIPVDALQERGNEVFVYTSQDEDGNLSGEQTVETGLSDGDTVEIVSGLSEGDTVYYQRIGSSGSSSSSDSMGGFGGMRGGESSGGGGGMMGGESSGGGGGMMGGGGGPGM